MPGCFLHERGANMEKDDMHLIVYKILRYLYGCNKQGKIPTFSDMFHVLELTRIPKSYLAQILNELADCGYIAGCSVTVTKDGTLITLADDARITMAGADYLNDNSRMKKAADVAGRAFELILEGVIACAMPK